MRAHESSDISRDFRFHLAADCDRQQGEQLDGAKATSGICHERTEVAMRPNEGARIEMILVTTRPQIARILD
jgi:hypothetical protein